MAHQVKNWYLEEHHRDSIKLSWPIAADKSICIDVSCPPFKTSKPISLNISCGYSFNSPDILCFSLEYVNIFFNLDKTVKAF